MTLYTIGYGNRKPELFFALIPEGATVIDVRRNPRGWSVKYSASSLRRRYGGDYFSSPSLGNDPILGSADKFVPAYGKKDAETALNSLATLVRGLDQFDAPPIVLLCAESDPKRCHRRFVAEEVAKRLPGLEIVHLGVEA